VTNLRRSASNNKTFKTGQSFRKNTHVPEVSQSRAGAVKITAIIVKPHHIGANPAVGHNLAGNPGNGSENLV
jgi:hypothetical protein